MSLREQLDILNAFEAAVQPLVMMRRDILLKTIPTSVTLYVDNLKPEYTYSNEVQECLRICDRAIDELAAIYRKKLL